MIIRDLEVVDLRMLVVLSILVIKVDIFFSCELFVFMWVRIELKMVSLVDL